MYKIVFFVPSDYLDDVKNALFMAGAGRVGKYSHCCWEKQGLGQFKPLEGSEPLIGQQNKLTKVDEFRVEMVCEDSHVKQAVIALRCSHPYEEPAFDVWRLADESSLP